MTREPRLTASSERKPYTQVGYDEIAILRDLGPSAYGVYTYLSLRLGRNATAWPGYRKMAVDLRMTDKTIKRAIDQLIANGLVTTHRPEFWQAQHYTIHDPRPLAEANRLESSPNLYDPKATPPVGETPTGEEAPPVGESTTGPTGETPTERVVKSTTKETSTKATSGKEHQSGDSTATPRSPREVRKGNDVLAAFVDRRGQQAIDPAIKGMQAGIAARLIRGTKTRRGYSFEDITGCMDYLETSGRPWDMRRLELELPTWIAANRPTAQNGHRPSQYKTVEEKNAEAFQTLYTHLGYQNGNTAHPDPDEDLEPDDGDYIEVAHRAATE